MTEFTLTPTASPTLDGGLDKLLNQHFGGKVVRKDLTKLIKEGANVPVYVLEYLLGMYCASDDAATIDAGLETVKRVLAENYVRPDEAEKVKSKIRERGSFKAGFVRGAAVQPGHQRRRNAGLVCARVRKAAGRGHLVHRHAAIPL